MDTILAENMKRLREKYNLTQEIVAVSLGVPDLVVYRWEAGREYPDKRMIKKIAEFYEISVDELLENKVEVIPEAPVSESLPENCKMCGGELVFNHLAGTCKCANCGKTKSITELYPGYVKYAPITKALNKANLILNNRTTLASADEAKLLFKQAAEECSKFNDEVSSELAKFCNDGLATVKQFEIYCRGKHFFKNKSYKSALVELEKVKGYRDADEMIARCKGSRGSKN
jgi:DNA-binding XRE family transcriptional regulator